MIKITKEELLIISQIAKRAIKEIPDYPDSQMTLIMDLESAHLNTRLNLQGLLLSEPSDFIHDICGIRRHINRETGKLEDCFIPRYAI